METKSKVKFLRYGNALLFEAQDGCLRAKTYNNKYSKEDEACDHCSENWETTQHILMECGGVHPVRLVGNVTVPEVLGFNVDRSINCTAVEISKTRLEY